MSPGLQSQDEHDDAGVRDKIRSITCGVVNARYQGERSVVRDTEWMMRSGNQGGVSNERQVQEKGWQV